MYIQEEKKPEYSNFGKSGYEDDEEYNPYQPEKDKSKDESYWKQYYDD